MAGIFIEPVKRRLSFLMIMPLLAIMPARLGLSADIAKPSLAEKQGKTLEQEREDRAPIAGEGFTTSLFGEPVEVPARNRRNVTAVDLGFAGLVPGPSESKILPFGAFYWYRASADDQRRFRAVVSGFYNDIKYCCGKSLPDPLEFVVGFENLWVPFDIPDYISGERIPAAELEEGKAALKFGVAGRWKVSPGFTDSAFQAALTYEPGYLFIERGHDTSPAFVKPENTVEHTVRLSLAYDGMTRNLLEYRHAGIACGMEVAGKFRGHDWHDWGMNGEEDGGSTREGLIWTGYLHAAGPVPLVSDQRRNRLVGGLHFALCEDVDRFSAPRIGGGPSGDEAGVLYMPLLPGAMINEYLSGRYLAAHIEYRRELLFFVFSHLRLTGAYLRRRYTTTTGTDFRNDFMGAATAGLSSDFLWNSMFRLDYSYNTDVIRDDGHGGHEVVLRWSKEF